MRGKTIVITGADGALGRVVGRVAAERGATLGLIDHGPMEKDAPAGALVYGGVDLSDFDAAKRVMDDIKAKTGRLDALLNIAGGFNWQTVTDGALDTWSALHKKNVLTAASASKAALPHLIASGAGRIINVGALAAVTKAGEGMGAYAASKAGVVKLTESLAEEMKAHNVTVNAVLPSIIDTPNNRKDMPNADFSKWVAPADLAAVMLFLASDEARAVTGALIPVTGKV